MAAAKKASFASKQTKAGPAPLASFEDLPSDEMDSPNSSFNDPDQDSLYLVSTCSNLEDLNLDSTTPGTITCSPVSALHIDVSQDCDSASQHTLTPCNATDEHDSLTCSTIPVCIVEPKSDSGSKDDHVFEPPKSPNIDNNDELQVNLTKNGRKGSWTDIFRSRSHSGSRSPQPSPQSPRKALPEIPIEDPKVSDGGKKSKKKSGGILSVFRFHDKKSDKQKSPVNPIPSINVPAEESGPSLSNSKPPGKQDTSVEEKKNNIVSAEKISSERIKENEIAGKVLENTVEASVDICANPPASKVTEKDVFEDFKHPELKAKLSLERKSKSLDHEPPIRDGSEDFKGSSESELAPEDPIEKKDEEEIDFEAETLLNQDSIEYDESLISESSILEVYKVETKTQPRRQRLEITMVPIDRPRSTTPISVAPFEAFIQSAQQTQTVDTSVEKLKVLLPGEQFCGRLKSPKKNLQKSWQDFCQSGLHSPRITKRPSNEVIDCDLSPPPGSNFNSQMSPFENSNTVLDDNFSRKWETFEFTKKGCSNNASESLVIGEESSSQTSELPSSQGFSLKKENLKLSFSSSLSSDSNNCSQENDAFEVQVHPQDW